MSDFKSRHAFGSEAKVDYAIEQGLIDAYDILFLKEGKIGWIDADGNKVILNDKTGVVSVDALPETGSKDTVYIYDNKFYLWDGSKFVIASGEGGIDENIVDEKISAAKAEVTESANAYTDEVVKTVEKKKYEIAYKPSGTLVDYGEREIRVLCPSDTQWTLQQSGAGADTNSYYIGFKAYAPSDDVVSFKEDLAEIIRDDTMYYFVDNEFAGIDEYGRKYSIVWLPVAKYDEASDTWTYHGSKSSGDRYIGWYYNVEWYNANGVAIASDCIRINLSNEDCHSLVKPFYISNAISAANTYTDEQIAAAISVIEF